MATETVYEVGAEGKISPAEKLDREINFMIMQINEAERGISRQEKALEKMRQELAEMKQKRAGMTSTI